MGSFIPKTSTCIYLTVVILLLFCVFFRNKDNDFSGIKNIMNKDVTDQVNYILSGKVGKQIKGEKNTIPEEIKNKNFSRPSLKSADLKMYAKIHELCRETLEYIFHKSFVESRPDFLKHPVTNKKHKLTAYNKKLNLAVEYKGIEHYIYPNFTNSTKEEFELALKIDNWKKERCDANGVYLISIPYTIEIENIPNYIWKNIPEHLKRFIVNNDKLKKI